MLRAAEFTSKNSKLEVANKEGDELFLTIIQKMNFFLEYPSTSTARVLVTE